VLLKVKAKDSNKNLTFKAKDRDKDSQTLDIYKYAWQSVFDIKTHEKCKET